MQTSSSAAKELFDNEQNLVKSGNSVVLSEEAIADATNTMTLSAKAANVAMKALAMAGNMLLMWGVSELLSLASTAISNWTNRVENAKEALDEFNSSVKEQKDKFSSEQDWINENAKKYEELAKGVDNYGHNVSLTSDEFSEYRQITKEIADMFPTMVSGYNEQNDAIIKNKGNVEALTKAYEDQRDAYYADIRKDANSTFKDFKTDTSEDSDYANRLNKFINGSTDTLFKKADDSIKFLKLFDNDAETLSEILNNGFDFSKLSADAQQKVRDVFTTLNTTVNTETEKVRPVLEAYLYGKSSGYNDLSDKGKEAINSFVQSMDSSFFEQFDSYSDMGSWVTKNVINPLKDGLDSNDIAVKIQTLFSLDQKDFSKYSDYVNAVLDIIKSLENQKDENGNNLFSTDQIQYFKTKLGVNTVDEDGNLSGKALLDERAKRYKTLVNKYSPNETNTKVNWKNTIGINPLSQSDDGVKTKIKTNKDDINNWLNNLNESDQKIAQSSNFEEALKKKKNALNGASLSLKDYKNALDEVKASEEKTGEKVSKISFAKAWKSLDSTDNDKLKSLKSDLTTLAESGKLTEKTFNKTSGAKTWLKEIGIDADVAIKKINSLVDSSKQLSTLKSGISQLQTALAEKKENKVVGADTLSSMEAEFGDLKSWKKYKETLGSTTSSLDDCRKAQNQLATEYINSNNFLSQLVDTKGKVDDSTKQYYIDQLKEMGVKNADKVVEAQIIQQKIDLILTNEKLSKSQKKELKNLTDEAKQLGLSQKKVKKYIELKTYASQNPLKTKDSIKNLMALAKQAGKTGESIYNLCEMLLLQRKFRNELRKKVPTNEADQHAYQSTLAEMENDIERTKQKIKDASKKVKITDEEVGNLGDAGGGVNVGDKKDSSSKKDKNKNTKTKQEFDWIDRRITVLNNKISLLNAQKENLFTVKSKNKNLKKQIKEMTKLLGTYSTAYSKYMAKANSVKLASSLKTKVRNGAIKGSYSQLIKEYGEKTANRIQKYMDYYDKAKSSKESWESTQKQINDAKIERLQNMADLYSDKSDYYSTRASKTSYSAKTQNKYLKYQQKALEKNYEYQIKIAKANGKTTEAKKLQLELDQQLLEIEKQKFDNISAKYTRKLDANTYSSDYLSNQVSIIEAKGLIANDSYYQKQISYSKKRNLLLVDERKSLNKQLNTIEKGSDEYYDCLATLRDINLQIQQNAQEQIEWNNAMAENDQKRFEAGQNRANRRITTNETMLSLIDHEDSTDAKTGQWTNAGKSRAWVYGYDLGVAEAMKSDSASNVADLKKLKAEGKYGDGYKYTSLKKLDEAIETAIQTDQANAKAVYDQRKNLAELVKDHYNQVSSYLSDLISKQEDLIDTQKDLYDYQKQIQEKTTNINTIRKQIAALRGNQDNPGNTSEEARAKLQKLQESLNDAQDDLNDTEYDKYISDQKNMLSKLQEDFKNFLEDYFKDFEALWKEGLNLTKNEDGTWLKNQSQKNGNYTPGKDDTKAGSDSKSQTSDKSGNLDANKDIDAGKSTISSSTKPQSPPAVESNKITKQQVAAWLTKKNANKKSGYEHLSFPTKNQKYSAVNKVLSKKYQATSTSKNSSGKVVKKKVGLVLTDAEIKKLCSYVGVKTSKTYGKTSPLYKKLKSLGIKGFSRGGVVDVDDISKQVKANGDTTLISAKKGERILTAEQNKAFEQLVDSSLKNTSFASNLNLPNMNNLVKSVPNNIDYGGVTFQFEVNGVSNPDEFVKAIQTNAKFQEAIRSVSIDRVNGKGRLNVNRIK